jgi:hypothetical protein
MNLDNKMLTVDSAIFKKYEDEIERLQKEIAEWKEKEFQACSKHHEFISEIERLERINLVATHLMTDKQLEKLKQLINK